MPEDSLPICSTLQHRILMLIYVLKFRQESTHWLQTVGDTFNDVVELINDEDLSDVRKQDIRLAMLNTKKEMLSIYCYLNIFKHNHVVLLYYVFGNNVSVICYNACNRLCAPWTLEK